MIMGKTVTELYVMLKLHEQTLPLKEVAPALHAIRAGRIQKNQKKKSHKAAKGNQGNDKAKIGYAPVQMASSSQSSNFVINFHRGCSFVRNPLTYDFEILSKVENVDISSMDYDALGRLIGSEFSGEVKSMFYLLPGKDLDSGLRCLNSDA
ncbi:hypothetical protein Tco_1176758 [Tanacetum coccineum]